MKTDITNARNSGYPLSITRSVFFARKLMNNDISNHIILRELAKNAGTNECTLKKAFKDIFKITVYQHLIAKRMHYARHLLTTTNYKEKDIAMHCGYGSLSAFITTFGRYFKMKPGELRRQCFKAPVIQK